MTQFQCAACGLAVIGPVRPLQDPSLVDTREQRDLVPKGHYLPAAQFKVWTPDWTRSVEEGDLIFNLDDVQNTRHGGILAGCCGLDGLDGINTFCVNGHEIGTERSDCWTQRFLHAPARNLVEVPNR